jgi:hypothetical protein
MKHVAGSKVNIVNKNVRKSFYYCTVHTLHRTHIILYQKEFTLYREISGTDNVTKAIKLKYMQYTILNHKTEIMPSHNRTQAGYMLL